MHRVNKYKAMAILTLKHDDKNVIARKTVGYILSLGVFEQADEESPYDPEFVKMVIEASRSKNRKRVDDVDAFIKSLS